MRRILRIFGSLLGLLVLASLVIVLTTTLRHLRTSPQPAAQLFQSPIETPTQPPYPPPGPPATPTVAPTPVSRCTFAARPASAEPATPLEAYQFSEPRVVLTHTSAIGIAGWLPDGQRLLITRLIPPALASEYVDTLDVTTGALQPYGERHGFDAKPVWLASEQAVAYTDFVNGDVVLRINWGKDVPVTQVATGLMSPYIAAGPEGQRVVFLSKEVDRQPQIFDVGLAQRQTLLLALPWMSAQDLLALGQQEGPIPYQAVWHPDGNRTAFYNDTGLYLVDLGTAQICEIDLGPHVDGKRWAVDARWSPNGRYLAALTTVGDPIVRFIDLTVIDMRSGETSHLDLGHQYLSALSWAPDSRQLVVLAEGERGTRANQYDLYVVDAMTGDSRQVLGEYTFMFSGAYGIAWSPTGRAVAIACPAVDSASGTIAEGRLCIISVEVKK